MARHAAEVEVEIRRQIVVTRQQVTLAKAYLQRLDSIRPHKPSELAKAFAQQQGFAMPSVVNVHETINPERELRQAAGYISCHFALVEAVYALVHSGYFLSRPEVENLSLHLPYFEGVPGGSGRNGSWSFDAFLPIKVILAFSLHQEQPQPLTDPDLFLLEAGLVGAHPEVEDALRDAVRCFRHELYQPSVSMLGKAVEGAWIEVGLALSKVVNGPGSQHTKFEQEITGVNASFFNTIEKISKLCRDHHKGNLQPVFSDANTRRTEIEQIAGWSHVVREARNAIHFGVQPVVGNSYEKVAALLLGTAGNLQTMYRLKTSADKIVP
ncbi:MAG: hypothetical protein Q8Q12_14780 [bacterium]|nr:hypothetical protein [bacterium]